MSKYRFPGGAEREKETKRKRTRHHAPAICRHDVLSVICLYVSCPGTPTLVASRVSESLGAP